MKTEYDFSNSAKNPYVEKLLLQTHRYKVRKISKDINDDYPTQTISANGFIDALRQYCAANGLAEPVGTYHSTDDVYTAVSSSRTANVIGKFQIYKCE
jgi:hypothetical protein